MTSGRTLNRARIVNPTPRLMYSVRPPGAVIIPAVYRGLRTGTIGGGRKGGRRLYISRGVGHYLPVRFNVRPEVTLFTLRPAD